MEIELAAEGIGSRSKQADNCIPVFELRAEPDKRASKEAGRPMFRNVPYVTILIPGDRDQVVRRVLDRDKARWPEQWRAFEEGLDARLSGTPLEQWKVHDRPHLDPAQIASLKAMHIMRVEDLAHLSDAAIQRLGPGGRNLVAEALAYISHGEEIAKVAAPIEELDELRKQVSELEDEIKELKAENRVLALNQKKRPGRKPTSRNDDVEDEPE